MSGISKTNSNISTEVSQLYEAGNRKFFAAEILPNGSYGAKEYHEGLMEVDLEFEQETEEVGADDNPAFITIAGPVTGEGTIKFAVLPYRVYSKFFNVTTDANGAVIISGESSRPKQVAFGYYTQVGDGTESMFTIYRATFSLPPLNSVSFDGQTIRDLTIPVRIVPHTYRDRQNRDKKVTYSILNSGLNSQIWAAAQAAIYVPDMALGG